MFTINASDNSLIPSSDEISTLRSFADVDGRSRSLLERVDAAASVPVTGHRSARRRHRQRLQPSHSPRHPIVRLLLGGLQGNADCANCNVSARRRLSHCCLIAVGGRDPLYKRSASVVGNCKLTGFLKAK